MEASWLAFGVALVFLLSGMVKGIIGMGLPTVAMAGLALLVSPATAAALLIVPALVTNIRQFAALPSAGAMSLRLAFLLGGIAVGTLAGVLPRLGGGSGFAHVALGLVLVMYGALGLGRLRLPPVDGRRRGLGFAVGYVTGSITAATGVSIIPSVPYLQALQLDKDGLVQAMGLSFTVATLALAVSLGVNAALTSELLFLSALALLPAVAGMRVGDAIRARVDEDRFRRWFFAGIALLGAAMVLRAL